MRILAARDGVIHGGRGWVGVSLEGMQECMMSRKRDLKEDHEASMSDDRIASQWVERRSSFIFGMSAFL